MTDAPSETPSELPKAYEPAQVEGGIYQRWLDARAFSADPDGRDDRYVIMMPLPNVTGALHMGHAMDNVMQDLLIRWQRMRGANSLWMAGTDHAGIATQAVVEKRLFELEGKTRHDIGRDALVERIWEWKAQYQARIVRQQQSMGCSCDWDRQRFTMDDVCARAVRYTFFRLFDDGLIYQGNRLVNWDCHLQTAVADDEIEYKTIDGHFWHLRYPIIDPQPGEPDHVIVATTRPETMLGDTAVACHPDPAAALERLIEKTREKLAQAPQKEHATLEEEIARLEERKRTHLPRLEQLAGMARDGRKIRLPLLDREIPLIVDEWAKPELGSGCVKITPGHDPNDYDVWTRHSEEIGLINILNVDGTLNDNAGPYATLDRFAARKRVVADLDAAGQLEATEDRKVELGHSDRSKTPIEPYISKQWFVRMGDVEGGVLCGRGTDKEFTTPGLAQAAIDAVAGDWRSPTGRKLTFHPDPERYANTYLNWLGEKRDWCISRQLWWGHQIPIWAADVDAAQLEKVQAAVAPFNDRDDVSAWWIAPDESRTPLADADSKSGGDDGRVLVCLLDRDTDGEVAAALEGAGLTRDPDVLDTWFSSSLWPHSTLGWPNPETAQVEEGQSPLGALGGNADCLDYFYPGSCLVTGRDIITLWVARMQIMGLYNLGDVPFTDCFLHANILDGKGERMSKSKGNGIDPVDIIERYGTDAMRYVLCDMQTGTQDIRLPVQAISPFTGNAIDLAKAKKGQTMYTFVCPESGKEFDVLGTMPDVPAAKLVSDRFEVGRNFCNKVWNAARFAFMNLDGVTFTPRALNDLEPEDRWILSRLAGAIDEVQKQLEAYNPSAATAAAREFFWSDLCDWYLELIKPRLQSDDGRAAAQQVLGAALDQTLRLLHPSVPFITEALWGSLVSIAPERGIESPFATSDQIVNAAWPESRGAWKDPEEERRFELLQGVVRGIRNVRKEYNIAPKERLSATVRATGASAAALEELRDHVISAAGLSDWSVAADVERAADAATAVVEDVEVFVAGVVDLEKERARLTKERDKLAGPLEGLRKKLSNENFVSRAKPEVVESERGRLAELEGKLAALEARIAELGS